VERNGTVLIPSPPGLAKNAAAEYLMRIAHIMKIMKIMSKEEEK